MKNGHLLLSLILLSGGIAMANCNCCNCCDCCSDCCTGYNYPPYAYNTRIPLRYRGYYTTRSITVNVGNSGMHRHSVAPPPPRHSGGHMNHHPHGGPGSTHHHHGSRVSGSIHVAI